MWAGSAQKNGPEEGGHGSAKKNARKPLSALGSEIAKKNEMRFKAGVRGEKGTLTVPGLSVTNLECRV